MFSYNFCNKPFCFLSKPDTNLQTLNIIVMCITSPNDRMVTRTFTDLTYLLVLVIARHGLGRFVNLNRCALLGHAFTHKLNSTYGDLYRVPTKFEENLFKDERALNHTRARTLAHAHMHAVIKHDKYVSHVTCGDL
jgi:hypothetical protein